MVLALCDKPLNDAKWESFAQSIFSGKSNAEAARIAGYSPSCAYVAANRLLKKAQVQSRIAYLQRVKTAKDLDKVLSPEQRMALLSKFAQEENYDKFGKLVRTGNVSAIAELNKMEGSYAPPRAPVDEEGRTLPPTMVFIMPEGTRMRLGGIKPLVIEQGE